MEKILTIIIPSYNISKYIESIMPHYLYEPLFKNVQLLFIDDGAKDNTVELLEKYSSKYPDYISIIHKENGGHGSVINYGIKLVKTKYFKVIDGDDWVDPVELDRLCNYLHSCDSDLVVSDFMYEYSDRSSLSKGIDHTKKFEYKIHLHNATFKTSLWKDNSLKVREKVFYEDAQFVLFPLEFIKTISYFEACIYHYRCDNPNQSVNPMQQLKHKDDYVLVAKDLCDFYVRLSTDLNFSKNTLDYIYENIVRIVFGAYEICSTKGLDFKDSVKLCKELDKTFKHYRCIYKGIAKKYRKFRLLKLFNYLGLKIYLKK